MYFSEGWVYTFDRVGLVEWKRYRCQSEGTVGQLSACRWNDDGPFYFDVTTGHLGSWAGPLSLLGEDHAMSWHSGTPTHEYYESPCEHSGD